MSGEIKSVSILNSLREHFESWTNIVSYDLVTLDTMCFTNKLVIKVDDDYFIAYVSDDGEECISDFDDITWYYAEQKQVISWEIA